MNYAVIAREPWQLDAQKPHDMECLIQEPSETNPLLGSACKSMTALNIEARTLLKP
jgi:hypothetical protein